MMGVNILSQKFSHYYYRIWALNTFINVLFMFMNIINLYFSSINFLLIFLLRMYYTNSILILFLLHMLQIPSLSMLFCLLFKKISCQNCHKFLWWYIFWLNSGRSYHNIFIFCFNIQISLSCLDLRFISIHCMK